MRITYGMILDAGLWDEYCTATGTNPWCVNEGLANRDTEAYDFPKDIALKLLEFGPKVSGIS